MSTIPAHFQLDARPLANPEAVVHGPQVRFSVLTSRLIRLEYAPDELFEDRPSQLIWYREQPLPLFEARAGEDEIEIETEYLLLRYQVTEKGFSPETLSITLKESGVVWCYGDAQTGNLLGTTRTLDEVSGSTRLELGLMSRDGWAVVDDLPRLVFDERSWLTGREAAAGTADLYFFGYGRDFKGCLQDYSRVTGPVPMFPRWVLGNWWSRYWSYSQEELTRLMVEFQTHDVPLSVCIVDMDWHLVDVGEGINGWTGYTWNRELFPDPAAFMHWLHSQGLKTALNLHPALGVRPYEAMYAEMARRLGIDPENGQTIPFDIADPDFARAYFEVLHHPQEEQGVDFWWIDWQQGESSALPGLDPLWLLNHLHFLDLGRDGWKRPFIFSRWGGLGNHRYPIGFSGDTHIDWPSLAFQPYFTAVAANVGYGWWSHDIGGHMMGVEEPELYARWVQSGLFSPILRLHSTKNPFHERRPWGYDAEIFRVTREAMQLRHAFIPYLYTMLWRNHRDSLPPVRPMYYDYPQDEAAYHCPQQYTFGSELIAAPFTTPADPDTRLSRQVIWLPPGEWYHFFTYERYSSGWQALYGSLSDIPVFARAGAIVPLGPKVGWGGLDNPAELDIHIFAGADNIFVLYEDDGESGNYTQGDYCQTTFEQRWQGDRLQFIISAVDGQRRHLPAARDYHLHIHGIAGPAQIEILVGTAERPSPHTYDPQSQTLHLSLAGLPVTDSLTLTVKAGPDTLSPAPVSAQDDRRLYQRLYDLVAAFKMASMAKAAVALKLEEIVADPVQLADFSGALKKSQFRALLETLTGAGYHYYNYGAGLPEAVVLWNNRGETGITFRYTEEGEGWDLENRFTVDSGVAPAFKAIAVKPPWQLRFDYLQLLTILHNGR